MMGIGNISGDVLSPRPTSGDEQTERDVFATMELLAAIASRLLNFSNSITYAILTRTWTVSRRMELVESIRLLADRVERIEPTEPG